MSVLTVKKIGAPYQAQFWMCPLLNWNKGDGTAAPAENHHFRRNLTFPGHIRRIFDDNDFLSIVPNAKQKQLRKINFHTQKNMEKI